MKGDHLIASGITLQPIGVVRSPRLDTADDYWGDVESVIALDPSRFSAESLSGLADFSHAEIVFLMDRVAPDSIQTGARRPRGRSDWPLVGIFAQRAKARPNRLGVSRCEILRVEGIKIVVRGLDAIDGSPVLDIKPYMREFDPRGEIRQPSWATEVMRDYYKNSR